MFTYESQLKESHKGEQMKRSFVIFTITYLLMMFISFLFADRVELSSGNIISGAILLEDDSKIVIRDQSGIEQSIPKLMVKAVYKDQPQKLDTLRIVDVQLKNNRTIKGYLTKEDDTYIYLVDDNEIEIKIDKSMINSVSYDFGQNQKSSYRNQPGMIEPQKQFQNQSKGPHNGWDIGFGAKIGYYFPAEEAIGDIYGGGLVFGGEIIMWKEKGLGVSLGIDRFSVTGEPIILRNISKGIKESIDAECSISVMPITITGLYRINNRSAEVIPYFGLGCGLYFVKEDLKLSYQGYSQSVSYSDNAFGFHLTAGMQFSKVFAEAKYSSASVNSEGAAGKSANIGGFNIFLGVRY